MGKFTMRYTDYDGERSGVTIPIANDPDPGDISSLIAALAGMTIGTQGEALSYVITREQEDDKTRPASPFAQRETKWLVSYQDTVNGRAGQFEIPTADLLVLADGGKVADPAHPNVVSLIGILETVMESKDGNPITVVEIRHVGRNI